MNLYLITYQTESKILGSKVTKISQNYVWLEGVTFDYVQRFEDTTKDGLNEIYKDDKDMDILSVTVIAVSKLDDDK